MGKVRLALATVLGLSLCLGGYGVAQNPGARQGHEGWSGYGGSNLQDHYSSLSQINRDNVKKLTVAWTYDTEEVGGLEVNPIVVGGVLYACTPTHHIVALDGATGKLLWKFDSGLTGIARSRGVSYWSDGHDSRIFAGFRSFLYAIDAKSWKINNQLWRRR